jgi:hypothetical protein
MTNGKIVIIAKHELLPKQIEDLEKIKKHFNLEEYETVPELKTFYIPNWKAKGVSSILSLPLPKSLIILLHENFQNVFIFNMLARGFVDDEKEAIDFVHKDYSKRTYIKLKNEKYKLVEYVGINKVIAVTIVNQPLSL